MATASTDIPIGSTVEISLGRGIVRFCGTTSFSTGKWVGIELFEPVGKNDGSVQGVAYFSCQMNYGVFVKASQIRAFQAPDLLPASNVSLTFLYVVNTVILTVSHSQALSQQPDRASVTQDRPVPVFHACHPHVLSRLLPPAHRVPTSLRPIQVYVVVPDSPLPLLLSVVRSLVLISKLL
jgi:dynactin 1